ncbi:MAG TPA: dTDP-4-dehydrorhamnose 3,5-epimerase [Anaeromyxobacteraceae bacterium]|nr:dTDP-4-dehydrorhamnose 3,5-epimerase [Anaeromyxobacteraceae bacterium]
MRFLPTGLRGTYVIEQERIVDERGWFARTWCSREFAERGLDPGLVQCSVSFNPRRGTVRGLHYQVPPFAEVKLVRCSRGALFDVAADLRPDSATFGRWIGVELTPENGRMLYIPRGFAHGFITLADATEVSYQMSTAFSPDHARGVRFSDPLVRVEWPRPPEVISPRDRDAPDLSPSQLEELRGL